MLLKRILNNWFITNCEIGYVEDTGLYFVGSPFEYKDGDLFRISVKIYEDETILLSDDGCLVKELELLGYSLSEIKEYNADGLLRYGIKFNGNELQLETTIRAINPKLYSFIFIISKVIKYWVEKKINKE
jgi:hypothetical protein